MYNFYLQWVWIAKLVTASEMKLICRSVVAKEEQGMYIEVRIPNIRK